MMTFGLGVSYDPTSWLFEYAGLDHIVTHPCLRLINVPYTPSPTDVPIVGRTTRWPTF